MYLFSNTSTLILTKSNDKSNSENPAGAKMERYLMLDYSYKRNKSYEILKFMTQLNYTPNSIRALLLHKCVTTH